MKQTTEIIEVVFEDIKLDYLVEYYFSILQFSNLEHFHVSADFCKININTKYMLYNDISQSSPGSFYFYFNNFKFNNYQIPKVGFQVYKYDSKYDLNLHFEEEILKSKISGTELFLSVKYLASILSCTNYFCGYEPAMDANTRFFTNSNLGPITNWNS
jgi:hypothetical protein